VRWLPVAAALVYGVVLFRRLPDIVGQLTWNADYVSQMAIAQSAGTAGKPARAVIIQIGYFWFDVLTFPLPFHQLVWDYAPSAMALAALLLMAWTSWRLAGRFAAVLSLSIGLAASPLVLATQAAQAYHGSTWFGTALLAAYLCWLLTTQRGRNTVIAVSAIVAVVAGIATASDPLLGPAGVGPFVAALLFIWRRERIARSKAAAATATAVCVAGVAGVTVLAGRLAGFTSSFPRGLTHVVPPEHLVGNLRQLVGGIFEVAGMPHAGSALGVVLGLIVLAADLLPLLWLIHSFRRPKPAPLTAVVAFWSASTLFVAGAFVFSDIPADFLENSARYLVPMFYVMVAIVPLWVAADVRRAAAVAVPLAALILANAWAVDQAARARDFEPSFSFDLNAPIAFLEERGLTHGYAAFDEASPMSVKTNFRLHVYPVTQLFVGPGDDCGATPPSGICPYAYNSASDWYRGGSGPTFILIDPYMVRLSRPPLADLDSVSAVYQVGRFTIYEYPDDVASHMGTPERFKRPLL
jgi:hypothetical protein